MLQQESSSFANVRYRRNSGAQRVNRSARILVQKQRQQPETEEPLTDFSIACTFI